MTSLVKRNNSLSPLWRDDFFSAFQQDFDRVFDQFLNTRVNDLEIVGDYPKMDALIDGNNFRITFALAGMKSEDVEVSLDKNVLTISGRIASEYRSPDALYTQQPSHLIREIKQSAFKRSITLPTWVKQEEGSGWPAQPEAVMKDGMLTLTWPIASPKVPENKSKKIEIKSE